jgi:hypothetical protein
MAATNVLATTDSNEAFDRRVIAEVSQMKLSIQKNLHRNKPF